MLEVEVLEEFGAEPVTLEEAKVFCRVDADYTGDDDMLTSLIKSARQRIEHFANISLVPKRVRAFWDEVGYTLNLPFYPVREIESVVDDEGESVYYKPKGKHKIEVPHASDFFVTYTTGYEVLPDDLKLAVLKQVLTDYDHRENFVINGNTQQLTGVNLSNDAKSLIAPHNRTLIWL